MQFTMQCVNKGCGQLQSPYLDPKTDKIYCSVCDEEIKNGTVFIKNQMRLQKQFRQPKKNSFSTKCPSCNLEDRPIKIESSWHCKGCKSELKLTTSFRQVLEMFATSSKDL